MNVSVTDVMGLSKLEVGKRAMFGSGPEWL